MRKFKSYKWQVIIALLFVFLYGCQDNNEPELLFNNLPSVRVKKKITEVKSFLQESENGWKITYYPDDTQLGGYTFLFNFISNTEVKMHSDFGNPDPDKVSLYDITFGSTLKLLFTTKNVIHELSDGANFPDEDLRGQGYRGDFEFLFSSIEGDDIIFRSNRDASNYLRFKKASKSDWVDLSKNIEIQEKMSNNPLKSVFRKLTIGDKIYNFSYSPRRRRIIGTHPDLETVDIAVAITTTGIIVSPAINVGDKEVTHLTYDSTNDIFVYEEEGSVLVSIEYTNAPAAPLDPYPFGETVDNARYNFLEPEKTSLAFRTFYAEFSDNLLATYNLSLDRVYMRNLLPTTDTPYIHIYTNAGRFLWFFSYEIRDDGKIYFTLTGDASTNVTPAITTVFEPLFKIIIGSELGYYTDKTGGLQRFTNGTFSMINASQSQYSINYYDF